MNKMMVAVFDSEIAAFEGLSALKDLHNKGDITLYASAVFVKDASGHVNVKQSADEGPIGTALGMFVGSVVGILGGPVGLVVGASIGGLAGLVSDLNNSGIDIEFLDDISNSISPGKSALLAEIEESWTVPVDTRLSNLGGLVFRRLRAEVIEDQITRETATFKNEIKQLKEELAQAHAEDKLAIQIHIDEAKKKIVVIQDQIKNKIKQAKDEADSKITALQEQLKQASDKQKDKIEKRIEKVKADLDIRHQKLQEAGRLTKEALL